MTRSVSNSPNTNHPRRRSLRLRAINAVGDVEDAKIAYLSPEKGKIDGKNEEISPRITRVDSDDDDVRIISSITLKDLKKCCKAKKRKNLKSVDLPDMLSYEQVVPKEEEVDLDEPLIKLKTSRASVTNKKRRTDADKYSDAISTSLSSHPQGYAEENLGLTAVKDSKGTVNNSLLQTTPSKRDLLASDGELTYDIKTEIVELSSLYCQSKHNVDFGEGSHQNAIANSGPTGEFIAKRISLKDTSITSLNEGSVVYSEVNEISSTSLNSLNEVSVECKVPEKHAWFSESSENHVDDADENTLKISGQKHFKIDSKKLFISDLNTDNCCFNTNDISFVEETMLGAKVNQMTDTASKQLCQQGEKAFCVQKGTRDVITLNQMPTCQQRDNEGIDHKHYKELFGLEEIFLPLSMEDRHQGDSPMFLDVMIENGQCQGNENVNGQTNKLFDDGRYHPCSPTFSTTCGSSSCVPYDESSSPRELLQEKEDQLNDQLVTMTIQLCDKDAYLGVVEDFCVECPETSKQCHSSVPSEECADTDVPIVSEVCHTLEVKADSSAAQRTIDTQNNQPQFDQRMMVDNSPIKLLSQRKLDTIKMQTLSPNSQEKLFKVLSNIDLHDASPLVDHQRIRKRPRNNHSNSLSPSTRKGINNLKEASYKRPCISNVLPPKPMDKAIEFSQRQFHDIEKIALKLLSGLNSLKSIVEDTLDLDGICSLASRFSVNEIKAAIEDASEAEKTTKKWLSIMAKDCNRFCKIMRSAENGSMTSDYSVQKGRRKITFADEVGGDLCQVKIFEKSQSPVPEFKYASP